MGREPLRSRLWFWLLKKAGWQEGTYYPIWARMLFPLVFPLKWLRWRIKEKEGYQWDRDIWIINGEEFSGEVLRTLAYAERVFFYLERENGSVMIHQSDSPQKCLAHLVHVYERVN